MKAKCRDECHQHARLADTSAGARELAPRAAPVRAASGRKNPASRAGSDLPRKDPARGLGPAAKAEPRCGFIPPLRTFGQGPCGAVAIPDRWSHVRAVPCSPRQAPPCWLPPELLVPVRFVACGSACWPSSGVHLLSLPRLVRVGVGLSASLWWCLRHQFWLCHWK